MIPAMSADAAQAWFVAGTVPLIVGGALHAAAGLVDLVRPTFFAPLSASAQAPAAETGIRLKAMFPGDDAHPSMWRVWLGIHIGFGLGLVAFGLTCLLVAAHDYALVEGIAALRPLAIAVAASYLALSLRFFFYGPVLITGSATVCFVVATVLPA